MTHNQDITINGTLIDQQGLIRSHNVHASWLDPNTIVIGDYEHNLSDFTVSDDRLLSVHGWVLIF